MDHEDLHRDFSLRILPRPGVTGHYLGPCGRHGHAFTTAHGIDNWYATTIAQAGLASIHWRNRIVIASLNLQRHYESVAQHIQQETLGCQRNYLDSR